MTKTNAKALGIVAGDEATSDASITFNNNSPWDFDRSNEIINGDENTRWASAAELT